jgi:hypothetical protein
MRNNCFRPQQTRTKVLRRELSPGDPITHKILWTLYFVTLFWRSAELEAHYYYTFMPNSTQGSRPWKANNRLATQHVPRPLCNSKVRYRDHQSPTWDPIMKRNNVFHILKIHFNIIFVSTPCSSTQSILIVFASKLLYVFLISPLDTSFPAHFIFRNLIGLGQ